MLRNGLVIYEPKGRAGEYAPLAVNLYDSCAHRCLYCYAPRALHKKPETWGLDPKPRPDIIARLQRDAPKAAADGAKGNVLLCFTCDPYQPIDQIHHLAEEAIHILHDNGFNITVLTKGGSRALRDFYYYHEGDEFATTLTFLDEQRSRQWEPQAALPANRIETLKKAHDLGIKTWVSLEPVIEPAETLEIIRQTHTFVDFFKVGTLNNHPQAKKIDWPKFAKDVVATLQHHRCDYYIKKDLRRYL